MEARLHDQLGMGIIGTYYSNSSRVRATTAVGVTVNYHRQTFNKLQALRLTQYERVIVVDNDAALLGNIDHLGSVAACVRNAGCSVAQHLSGHVPVERALRGHDWPDGVLFAPVLASYDKALRRLTDRHATRHGAARWRRPGVLAQLNQLYDRGMFELPIRYHAHNGVRMNESDWAEVRLLHIISGLRAKEGHLPTL